MSTPSDFSEVQPGLLPIGTLLEGFGTIAQVSLTAYRVEWAEPCAYGTFTRSEWLPFSAVHGAPAPVEPLVVFG